MYLRFGILFLTEILNFRMYERFEQLFNKSDICLNDLLNLLGQTYENPMDLASQDHLRYFKAQKASEGRRFHERDSQSHIEKHQKTNRSNRALPTLST